jgi:hypothetical protein
MAPDAGVHVLGVRLYSAVMAGHARHVPTEREALIFLAAAFALENAVGFYDATIISKFITRECLVWWLVARKGRMI